MRSSRTTSAVSLQDKTAEQLRSEIHSLEEILEERTRYHTHLEERVEAENSPVEDMESSVQEEERLRFRNAHITRELQRMEEEEKRFGSDPRVLDKKNEIKVVQRDIAEAEKEIATLQAVQKRRDKGLIEFGQLEAKARRMRGKMGEQAAEQRSSTKELQEVLRNLEKEDLEAHERTARMQGRLKAGVRAEDVERLQVAIASQVEELEQLSAKEAEWRQRREEVRDVGHRSVAKEKREIARLQREIEALNEELQRKNAELRKSTYTSNQAVYAA